MDINDNLERFITAQASSYERALSEIKGGRKLTHWMWYVFPQIGGLGRSAMAMKYAIENKEEAVAYYKHELLGSRLIEITTAFLALDNTTANAVLGSPDDLKMKSSMTLFHLIQQEDSLFKEVLDKYYNGAMCSSTQQLLMR